MRQSVRDWMKKPSESSTNPILHSAAMRAIGDTLRLVAAKDVTITLMGESGVGKEVLARMVHELSARDGPFVAINCAAIPEPLFESELFGHERGAFTGASERVRGKIEAAEGGTLFLDEIGELPLHLQTKLLRFLENRRFMRVGGSKKIVANARVVLATLRPLEEEVRSGRFRHDLYYRIQGITIDVPPLRARRADIAPLFSRFLEELAAQHHVQLPRLSRDARRSLLSYDWPGNVRELRNVAQALCLLRSGRIVAGRDLPLRHRGVPNEVVISLDQTLAESTHRIVDAALAAEGGDARRTAARLGISLRTIQRHLEVPARRRKA